MSEIHSTVLWSVVLCWCCIELALMLYRDIRDGVLPALRRRREWRKLVEDVVIP